MKNNEIYIDFSLPRESRRRNDFLHTLASTVSSSSKKFSIIESKMGNRAAHYYCYGACSCATFQTWFSNFSRQREREIERERERGGGVQVLYKPTYVIRCELSRRAAFAFLLLYRQVRPRGLVQAVARTYCATKFLLLISSFRI